MLRLNVKSIVVRIAFVEQLSLTSIIENECNLMPDLDVPGCMIHKYATTMKHIISIIASLLMIKMDRESKLKVIHINQLARNQTIRFKYHFLIIIFKNGMSFGRSETGLHKLTKCTLNLITVSNSFRVIYW